MKIKVKLFASVRDICGFNEKELTVSDGLRVAQVIDLLEKNSPRLADERPTLLFAVNEAYCDDRFPLADGDVLAVFPPVSGG